MLPLAHVARRNHRLSSHWQLEVERETRERDQVPMFTETLFQAIPTRRSTAFCSVMWGPVSRSGTCGDSEQPLTILELIPSPQVRVSVDPPLCVRRGHPRTQYSVFNTRKLDAQI